MSNSRFPSKEPNESIRKALAILWPEGWKPESMPRPDWVPITSAIPGNRARAERWIREHVDTYSRNKQITSGKGVRDRLKTAISILEQMIEESENLDQTLSGPGLSEVFKRVPEDIKIENIHGLLLVYLEAVKKASEENPSKRGAGAATIGPFSEEGMERTPEKSFCEWLWILWFAVRGLPEMPEKGVRITDQRSDFQKFLGFAWDAASLSAKTAARKAQRGPAQTLPNFETMLRDHAFPMHRYLCEIVDRLRDSLMKGDHLDVSFHQIAVTGDVVRGPISGGSGQD